MRGIGIVAHQHAVLSAQPRVDGREVQPTGQALEDHGHLLHHVGNLVHICANQGMGHAAGGGQALHVFIGRLSHAL